MKFCEYILNYYFTIIWYISLNISRFYYRIIKIVTYNFFSYWRNNSYLVRLTPLHGEMQQIIKDIRQNSTDVSYYYFDIVMFQNAIYPLFWYFFHILKYYRLLNLEEKY